MDHQTFLLDLIRIKFGFMALFHYLFVPLTLGLVVVVSCMETAFVWTRDNVWRLSAHFWFRLFVLGWLVGIVTGYPLRTQLATDWGNYFSFVKPVFDQVLPIEADLGPVMIIAIAAIAFVGDRLYPVARMFIMWVLTAAMLVQAATILSVNAWMQHPMISSKDGGFTGTPTFAEMLANPVAISKITHVYSAALVCGATFICVIAAMYLYRRQHLPVAKTSLRLGIPLGVIATVAVLVTGHFSADHVARYQPMKFAAMEGLWHHEEGQAGLVLFALPQAQSQSNINEIKIPYLLSLLAGYGFAGGSPPGISEMVAEHEGKIRAAVGLEQPTALPGSPPPPGSNTQATTQATVKHWIENAPLPGTPQLPSSTPAPSSMPLADATPLAVSLNGFRALYDEEMAHVNGDRSPQNIPQAEIVHRAALRTVPNVPVLFGGFHAMVYMAMTLLGVFGLAWIWRKRLLEERYRGLLVLVPAVLPLPWIGSSAGWVLAEMGRQPWVVYGFLPTLNGAALPALSHGVFGTVLVTSLYVSLAFLFSLLGLRLIRRGPGAPLISASWWRRLSGLVAPTPMSQT